MAKKNTKKKQESDIFTKICKNSLGVECFKEYRFHPTRRWRFDYAIPSHKIALEVEGGVWIQGRHTRPQGFLKDMEKYNTASALGWRVLRTTPSELLKLATINLLKQAMQSSFKKG